MHEVGGPIDGASDCHFFDNRKHLLFDYNENICYLMKVLFHYLMKVTFFFKYYHLFIGLYVKHNLFCKYIRNMYIIKCILIIHVTTVSVTSESHMGVCSILEIPKTSKYVNQLQI